MRIVNFDKREVTELIEKINTGKPIHAIRGRAPLTELVTTAAVCLALVQEHEAAYLATHHGGMHLEHLELAGQLRRNDVTAALLLATDLCLRIMAGTYDEHCAERLRAGVVMDVEPAYQALGIEGIREDCPLFGDVLTREELAQYVHHRLTPADGAG